MISKRRHIIILFILFLVRPSSGEEENSDTFSSLSKWMITNGGSVSSQLDMRTVNKSGLRGIVATENISASTILIGCPFRLIIGFEQRENLCDVFKSVHDELLKENSLFAPYLSLDDSLNSRIPNMWSDKTLNELQGLPPTDANRHTKWVQNTCNIDVEEDDLAMKAFLMVITRASQHGMVPIYDLLNHNNGDLNTVIESSEEEKEFRVVSSRDILKGEEIFVTYGNGSVSDILRDYGFIQGWPQLWEWEDSSTTKNYFLVVPGEDGQDLVAIEPSKDITAWIGQPNVPLSTYHALIKAHMASIDEDVLIRFQMGARKWLEERTSIKSDKTTLFYGKKQLTKASLDIVPAGFDYATEERNRLNDIMMVIDYRLRFKKAVTGALSIATEILTNEL